MVKTGTNDTLLDELRRLTLYPPEERQLAELRLKIEGKFSDSHNPPDGLESAKYSMLFFGMARKAIEQEAEQGGKISFAPEPTDTTVAICLDNLALMGPCGRNMAAILLCNKLLPFSRVKGWFAEQQDKIAIAVADRMTVIHCADMPERIRFAQSVLERASKLDLHKSIDFFARNGTRKGQLSFSSLGRFMSGKYGKTCREKLRCPESLEEITLCTESMPPYPDKEMLKDISFHLKTMDPIIMEKVLRAVIRFADEIDDELLKEIRQLTGSASLPLAKAALDALIKFGGIGRGKIFAQTFNDSPKIRAEIINRVPLLSSDNFSRFMNGISNVFHDPVLAMLYSTISEEDPQCFGNTLSNLLKHSRSKKKNDLKPLLAEILARGSFEEPLRPEIPEAKKVPGVDFIKQGGPIMLNIEQKKEHQTGFKRIFGQSQTQSDGLPDIFTDGQITNQRLHKLNKRKSLCRGLTFQNCTFTACEFRESLMEECLFKGCSFEACTFADAVFLESEFKDCSFSGCSLNKITFYDCSLKNCTFETSHLDYATTFLSTFKKCRFEAVAASGAYFCRTNFSVTTFRLCDFRETLFYKNKINGCDFFFSDFATALFRDGIFSCSDFQECSTIHCRAMNMLTESPELLKAMIRTFSTRLDKRERRKEKSTGFGKINEYSKDILGKTIKRWFALKDIDRNYANFAANNKRRLEWAAAKLDSKKRELLQIIPALLHTNIFEVNSGLDLNGISSRINGYELTLQTAEVLRNFFPETPYKAGGRDSIPIESFMSIGSTGTIAQTRDSDLDCWVCCNFKGKPSESREKLAEKFKHIEEWSMKEFGLELHFFIMDIREIRNNQFGLSDEESSGSAQSAILKEEFYRTALLLAGKPPLWWFTPPEARDQVYEAGKKRVALLKGKNFCVDLGNVPDIPVEEFFGASLWQIVKGIKSPFKAIMKFGLLELYTSDSKYSLLCEKLKENVRQGTYHIHRVDPYMLLYRELAVFFALQNNKKYVWLTAMALRLKCGLVGENGIEKVPTRPEEMELVKFSENLSGEAPEGTVHGFKDLSDFSSVVRLGKQINQFMVNTYMKVRGEQDKFPGVAITPEDLTRLGRVIFSIFAKRKNKILRLSLPGPRTHFFNSINISRRDKGKIWDIHGEYPDDSGSRKVMAAIESGPDLNCMLVWLALNGLYNHDMQVKTDISSGPLREREIKKLFSDLMHFFPPQKTFSVALEETLNAERIIKGFFILNLCVPPEITKVQEAHFVYSTNWGEVFCKPLKVDIKLVETPENYLKENMGALCDGEIVLGQFVPHNSACPLLKIPVK
ncbi:class I adenylate cyclase [Maridesulfovibrio sp.]|uniref:class I adenylate cyclase n=1 Tax=Maridesulfovibrio sp. TaxID=2795000 RepID=UPI0029CA22FF|nr:class I adenylate cyclase [Maridesulfovibrio sp.]